LFVYSFVGFIFSFSFSFYFPSCMAHKQGNEMLIQVRGDGAYSRDLFAAVLEILHLALAEFPSIEWERLVRFPEHVQRNTDVRRQSGIVERLDCFGFISFLIFYSLTRFVFYSYLLWYRQSMDCLAAIAVPSLILTSDHTIPAHVDQTGGAGEALL
jgi:hypothetical protein